MVAGVVMGDDNTLPAWWPSSHMIRFERCRLIDPDRPIDQIAYPNPREKNWGCFSQDGHLFVIDALPRSPDGETPLHDYVPGIWPTVGDVRKLRDAMVKLGWTRDYDAP